MIPPMKRIGFLSFGHWSDVGKTTLRRSRGSLKPDGVFVATDGLENLLTWAGMRLVGRKRLRFASGRRSREDILFLKQLIEAGEYRAVVDRVYAMDQVVEAHRYVQTWHKAGNVVLTIP
jgi:NADPH:quinone reductase-like Zn-dependent oxidoreductase